MIEQAKRTVAETGLQDKNIELRVADMAKSHLPNSSADIVISNCVINLCPDKDAIFEEAFRIVRPGGRLAVSDIVLTEDIDAQLRERFQSTWAGCLGGAILEEAYWEMVRKSGFADLQIVARHTLTPEELEAMACCPGEEFVPPPSEEDRVCVEGKVLSVKFTALRPFKD
jgi:SAM-dependent methyltransferase